MLPEEFERLRPGDWLAIEGKRYEVLYTQQEATVDREPRLFLNVALHREESPSVEPSECLEYYPDDGLLILCKRDARVRIEAAEITLEHGPDSADS